MTAAPVQPRVNVLAAMNRLYVVARDAEEPFDELDFAGDLRPYTESERIGRARFALLRDARFEHVAPMSVSAGRRLTTRIIRGRPILVTPVVWTLLRHLDRASTPLDCRQLAERIGCYWLRIKQHVLCARRALAQSQSGLEIRWTQYDGYELAEVSS